MAGFDPSVSASMMNAAIIQKSELDTVIKWNFESSKIEEDHTGLWIVKIYDEKDYILDFEFEIIAAREPEME